MYRFVPAHLIPSAHDTWLFITYEKNKTKSIEVSTEGKTSHGIQRSIIRCPDRTLIICNRSAYRPMNTSFDEAIGLTVFDKNSIFNDIKIGLISAELGKNHVDLDSIPKDHDLMADSGGFQLRIGTATFVDPYKVINWMNRNATIGCSLDVAPRWVDYSNKDKIDSEILASLKAQIYNNKIFLEYRRKDLKLLNVLHGYNFMQHGIWAEQVYEKGFEGWAIGTEGTIFNALGGALHLIETYPKNHYHFFGMGSTGRSIPFAWLGKYVKLITSDTTTHRNAAMSREIQFLDPFGAIKMYHTGEIKEYKKYAPTHIPCCCDVCFKAGTKVRTEKGWKNIESIKIGDRVLASDGNYHKVTITFKNKFKGKLNVILPNVSTKPIYATPNHPFLNLVGYKSTSNRNKNSLMNVRLGKTTGNLNISKCSLRWTKADSIKKGDWLVPCYNTDIKDVNIIKIPETFLKTNKKGPKRKGKSEFNVDTEFLWIIGMYIAEGSKGTRKIQFSLHEDEIKYRKKIINFFEKHGYNTRIAHHDSKGIDIVINSTTLALWIPSLLGSKCYKKHIPNIFMRLPKNKIKALIKGIYDGDGWITDNICTITQTSEILALQLTELLHRINEQPSVNRLTRTIMPNGKMRRLAYTVSWSNKKNKRIRNGKCIFKDKVLSAVRDVSTEIFSGFVYNLEVEGCHTYVVNGIIVHNCNKVRYIDVYGLPSKYFGDRLLLWHNMTTLNRQSQYWNNLARKCDIEEYVHWIHIALGKGRLNKKLDIIEHVKFIEKGIKEGAKKALKHYQSYVKNDPDEETSMSIVDMFGFKNRAKEEKEEETKSSAFSAARKGTKVSCSIDIVPNYLSIKRLKEEFGIDLKNNDEYIEYKEKEELDRKNLIAEKGSGESFDIKTIRKIPLKHIKEFRKNRLKELEAK